MQNYFNEDYLQKLVKDYIRLLNQTKEQEKNGDEEQLRMNQFRCNRVLEKIIKILDSLNIRVINTKYKLFSEGMNLIVQKSYELELKELLRNEILQQQIKFIERIDFNRNSKLYSMFTQIQENIIKYNIQREVKQTNYFVNLPKEDGEEENYTQSFFDHVNVLKQNGEEIRKTVYQYIDPDDEENDQAEFLLQKFFLKISKKILEQLKKQEFVQQDEYEMFIISLNLITKSLQFYNPQTKFKTEQYKSRLEQYKKLVEILEQKEIDKDLKEQLVQEKLEEIFDKLKLNNQLEIEKQLFLINSKTRKEIFRKYLLFLQKHIINEWEENRKGKGSEKQLNQSMKRQYEQLYKTYKLQLNTFLNQQNIESLIIGSHLVPSLENQNKYKQVYYEIFNIPNNFTFELENEIEDSNLLNNLNQYKDTINEMLENEFLIYEPNYKLLIVEQQKQQFLIQSLEIIENKSKSIFDEKLSNIIQQTNKIKQQIDEILQVFGESKITNNKFNLNTENIDDTHELNEKVEDFSDQEQSLLKRNLISSEDDEIIPWKPNPVKTVEEQKRILKELERM